jgi:EAL domain-containing protein (putative c-di-GMP-specific phosphodiesterase class I)
MGVSFFPTDGLDAATLLRNADSAMYTAKYRGKNDLQCFSAESGDHALKRLELENDLRRATEKGELAISHEIEVDREGRLAGLEVLLTWDHPALGRIPPSQFIPIAEESGMIVPIGIWVLRQACQQAAAWRTAGFPAIPTAVNVSAVQFAQADFVDTVAAILAETGLHPSQLELELTESLLMRDAEQSIHRMASLRKLGVRIAIDDFGTGYSSLSYLRRLPADSLKIDQSFLVELEMSPVRPQLIRTIVTMAHNMGLSVTAEGVETREQFELVHDADCDRAQGHLFGGPLTPSAVEEIMRNPQALIDRIVGS